MSDANHRPVFEVAAHVGCDAGWLAVQVMEQFALLSDNSRVIPLG